MTVVQINATYKIGSTGKIMSDLHNILLQNGHKSYMVSAYAVQNDEPNLYSTSKIPAFINTKLNLLKSRISGRMGYTHKKETIKIVKWIDNKKPDIIHLHNIHGNWIHLETLFNYIRENDIPVIWTLHDCWAFTGRCSHFELCKCEKWKTQCYKCKNNKVYPISYFFDRTKSMYNDKKKWFTSIPNMIIVTPSVWLANYVQQSFLNKYPIKTINNAIDLKVFKPTQNNFRKKHNCENKFILLGVAFDWGERKGLDVFIELSKQLDTSYQIVLVGTDSSLDKTLPKNIISIHRTNSQTELAEIYTAADLFVNPTREDNFPTTNIEALACGTPVITFKTGGSPESIDNKCGTVIEYDNIKALKEEIIRIKNKKPYSSKDCIKRVKMFDKNIKFNEYIELYKKL